MNFSSNKHQQPVQL